MDRMKIGDLFRKYRLVGVVLLIGISLMLLPSGTENQVQTPEPTEPVNADVEARLRQILGRIDGAGEVDVMLTEAAGEEIVYQTDGDPGDTVLITDADRNERGLVRTRQPPSYRGAVVVCTGADSAAVRLAIVDAVSKVTGLGSDKISVLKME